jgi:hypothetical protein
MSSEAVDNDTPSEAPDSHEIEVEVESRMTLITSKRTGHPQPGNAPAPDEPPLDSGTITGGKLADDH